MKVQPACFQGGEAQMEGSTLKDALEKDAGSSPATSTNGL